MENMSAELKNERGTVTIANNVLAKLAGYAASKCYGVVGMAVRGGKDGLARLLNRENIDRGIKIHVEENKVDILLCIIVEYGVNITTVGESIRQNVKYHLEEMTGMEVRSVTVRVESIRVD